MKYKFSNKKTRNKFKPKDLYLETLKPTRNIFTDREIQMEITVSEK
jgi:hypothetical protein